MPKRFWLSLAATMLFAGCAAISPEGSSKDPSVPPASDMDPLAPGMIPAECEALLQKSQEWGYEPGEKWTPHSLDEAEEALAFFAKFTIVPEAQSRALSAWLGTPQSLSPESARKAVEVVNGIQTCDSILSMWMLDGLMQFRWAPSERAKVSQALHQFLLNQQARVSGLVARAVSVHVLHEARKRKLLPGSVTKAAGLRAEFERTRNSLHPEAAEDDFLAQEKKIRAELAASNRLREALARELPLP